MYGIFWFRTIFWNTRATDVCGWREWDGLGGGWAWLFSGLSVGWGSPPLPKGSCVFSVCLLLGAGTAWPSFAAPLAALLHRTWSFSACWEDKRSQAQSHAVLSWHLPLWELKPLSTALSFSARPVSQGGGPLGCSHIEKLGGAWGTLWPGSRSQI